MSGCSKRTVKWGLVWRPRWGCLNGWLLRSGFAYARWDGRGVPAGVAGEDIPASVRVSIVARDLELWARETSTEAARPGTSSHATHPDQWVATMIAFHDAIASRRVESR